MTSLTAKLSAGCNLSSIFSSDISFLYPYLIYPKCQTKSRLLQLKEIQESCLGSIRICWNVKERLYVTLPRSCHRCGFSNDITKAIFDTRMRFCSPFASASVGLTSLSAFWAPPGFQSGWYFIAQAVVDTLSRSHRFYPPPVSRSSPA